MGAERLRRDTDLHSITRMKYRDSVRRTTSLVSCAALFALTFAFSPLVAFCEEEHHAGHSASFSTLIPFWINFAIYVAILYFILRNKVAAGWGSRRDTIVEAVQKGTAAREGAKERLELAQRQWEKVEQSIQATKSEIAASADAEAKLLVSDAKARAQRMLEQARESAQGELRAAEIKLRRECAHRVVDRATEELKRKLTVDSDKLRRERTMSSVRQLVQ